MPELPEVETILRGIAPSLIGQTIESTVVRQPRLRWRVPAALSRELPGQPIHALSRRAKYLLLTTPAGTVILHLGMSGSLRIVPAGRPAEKFDHVDIVLTNGNCLRLRDPRRFGAVLWTRDDPAQHSLLKDLGPEPLSTQMSGDYLFRLTRRRKRAIRDVLLDGRLIAGIGNIYANEALFVAGIRPQRAAGRLTRAGCDHLFQAIQSTLLRAIDAGGTTLRDFVASDGSPGYFQQELNVYGRQGLPCRHCGVPITSKTLGQRTAFYCSHCQK